MRNGERKRGGAGARGRRWALFVPSFALFLLAGCDTLHVQRPLRVTPSAVLTEGGAGEHPHTAVAAPAPPLEQAWRYDAEGGFGPAPALVTGAELVVATRHGEVHLVDVATGNRLGKMGFGDAVEGAPVLVDGRLLLLPVAGGKYGLIAYDLVSAQRLWSRRGDLHLAGLLLTDGVLVAAAYDGTVRGLDPRTGAEQWAHRPDSLASYFATPTRLDADRVAVADNRGRVTALDPATGAIAWTADVGAPVHETPAAAGGLLLLPTTHGRLVALDAATGAVRWSYEAASPDALVASPAAAGDAVVVGASDGVLRRLDLATGAEVWAHRFDGNVAAAPLVAGERVYVGTLGEQLAALDLSSGAEQWSRRLSGRIKSAPVVAGDLLVVLAEPRFVYAFRAADGARVVPSRGVAAR